MADNEPEDKLLGRFRRAVFKAGVIQECKRRMFFESSQERKKRKVREASKRNRRRFRFPSPFSLVSFIPFNLTTKKKSVSGFIICALNLMFVVLVNFHNLGLGSSF